MTHPLRGRAKGQLSGRKGGAHVTADVLRRSLGDNPSSNDPSICMAALVNAGSGDLGITFSAVPSV